MDFSQLLCSGFQFLNLDDACEAEVDILQDMLFKQQDATQLSKLFHLKTFPEGESCYGKYFIEDHHHGLHHHPGGVVEEIGGGGLCDHQEEEEEDEQEAIQQQLHQQQEPPLPDVSSIQMANGPLVQISPQHQHQQQQQQQQHVINVDQNPGECGASGGGDINNPPMLPSMPQPLRSYYSQQHVSVVHGSPGQGSPGMGQQHVSPAGYSHVQVPISMHQQQLIMMPAQPQAGQPFHSLGMPPSAVHFVAPQRQHHGHPPHNYVQGGPPQNKYNNGPRKSHSNRSRRGEQDAANMMNNYQAAAYYQGMYPQGIVPGIHHGYNLQQQFAHTVTGSPIIMQPAGHHKQAPVTMYATHQYSSPPPPQNNPVTPHTSPPENQQQHSPGLVEVQQQQHHSNPPIPSPSSSHHHHQQHHQQQQLQQQHQQQQIVPDNIEVNQAKDPSHEKQQQQQHPHEKQPQHQQPEVHFEAKRSEVMTSPPAAASKKDPIESRQVIQEGVNDEVEIKSRSSPVPDKKQDNNKCSSPVATSTTRTTTSQKDSRQTVVAPQRTQTWADASAAKPTNRPNPSSSSSVPSSSAAAPPAAGVVSVETLKDSKNKSSEFPALGGKSNVNGTGSASVLVAPMTVSSAPVVTSSTPTPTPAPPTPVQQQQQQQPSQKSWASVVCKNKTLSGNSFPSPAPSAAALAPANNNNGLNGSQQLPSAASSSSSFSSASAPASSVVSVGQDSSNNGSSDKKQNQGSGAAAGDNNGHVNVPIQSSSVVVDRAGGSGGGGRASDHQLSFDSSHLSNESDPLAIRLGEFLANYSLNHQATALTPRGLTNQSNFCYINATLQALMACPPFVNLFRSMKEVGLAKIPCKATPIIQSVFDFVSEFEPLNRGNTNKRDRRNDSSFITGANLEPSGIRKVLGLLDGSTFKVEGRQQDAEEFLSHLLNGLHDEMIKVIQWYEKSKSNGSSSMGQQVVVVGGSGGGGGGGGGVVNGGHPEVGSEDDGDADNWQVMGSKNKASVTRKTNIVKSPISEMLFGQLCSALQRTNERNNVRNLQPFFTLQLDIQNDNIKSIRDALEGLSTKEEVSGLVSISGQETTAWRQLSLEELPMILILHLKRFVYDKSGHKIQKLDKKLEFGIDLEIGKELLSVNTRSKWNQKQRTYKLFAVVYHDGEEAYKGHYIADCFHPSGGNIWGQVGWLRYDDITVKPIQDSAMLNSQPPRVPYLLYYRRADTLVSHHNNPQAPRNKDRPRNNNNSNSSNNSNFASSSES